MKLRIGLRTKLLLLSSFLFSIPWLGYQYVWEMEKYLRFGQEQTLMGTARALATALHERPKLFDNQASFLPSVEQGKDLYGFELKRPIQLNGNPNDWPRFQEQAHFYNENNRLSQPVSKNNEANETTINFTAAVGKFDKFLYLFFQINDDHLIYRANNSLSIVNNDHINLSFTNPLGEFSQYVIANKEQGWIDAFRISDLTQPYPVSAPFIQGTWQPTSTGYNVELRIPLAKLGDSIAFSVSDVDSEGGDVLTTLGSADTTMKEEAGTIVVPSPEIERIVKGMSYTYSSIWVIDQHQRVLASAGDLQSASGVWRSRGNNEQATSGWQKFEQKYLHPLYYKILTRPPSDFVDELYDASNLSGNHINQALSGKADSQWRLTTDQKAVVLSAAYPIFIADNVKGAVIVEETTNGIRTLRNRALEKLFTSILAILSLGTIAFFLFASRISNRIRRLRNQAELAIDEHGRIKNNLEAIKANDEIGDLSRSFSTAVNRLSQYNHYLENMSSRLSHELRTPIAVVRTSLENLTMEKIDEPAQAYIQRAQSGIERLNHILTSMSEATRIEQSLQSGETIQFNLVQVVTGCLSGFAQIHPDINFVAKISQQDLPMQGSPEHLAQALEKIISNAVDFTDNREVELTLEQDKGKAIIEIFNQGPLLPEQMQSKLFDSMVSVRSEAKQQEPHLGLGLFVARLICEYHHGSIQADNDEARQGVKITLTLPVDA